MSKLDDLIQQYCPDGVEWKTLGEATLMKRGTSATKGVMQEGSIPVISGGRQPAFYCNQSNRTGETITVAGSGAGAGYVQYWNEPIFVCDAFSVQGNEDLNTKFIYYFMTSIQEKIYATKKGGGVPHVHISSIDKFEIPVPPLPVQKEIVRILDTFTELQAELQAELQKRLQQYNYYRDNLLSFEGRTDVEWKRLGDIYSFQYGKGNTIPSGTGLYPVYGSNGIVGSFDEYNSEDAPVIGHIGAYAGIVNWGEGKHFVTYNGVICKLSSTSVLPRYGYYLLLIQNFIEKANKASQPFVSYNILEEPIVPVPSLAEQQRIVDILDRFDSLTNDLTAGLPAEIEKRRRQYEYYRDKLLTFKRKES